MFDNLSIAFGKYWIYKSNKSHWFISSTSMGSTVTSLGYLKLVKHLHSKYNPGHCRPRRMF